MSTSGLPPRISSPRDQVTALSLCVTLGSFGAHRYYVGRRLSGTLQLLITAVSFGGGGYAAWRAYLAHKYLPAILIIAVIMVAIAVWPLIDFWLLNTGRFRDKQGLPLLSPGIAVPPKHR